MRNDIDELFGNLRDEQGWDDETCLGLLAGFILDSGFHTAAREHLLAVAREEAAFADEPDPIDTPDRRLYADTTFHEDPKGPGFCDVCQWSREKHSESGRCPTEEW